MTDEDCSQMALERDLAVRQAKLALAHIRVIKIALNDSRPLEALRTANEAIDELEEELDEIEEINTASQEGDDVE